MRNKYSGATGINVLLGIWLIISTFVLTAFNNLPNARWNNVIVGILVAIFGLARFSSTAPTGLSWANLVLGIWLIISPFVLGFAHVVGAMWHNVIVGIIVGVLGWARALTPATAGRLKT
jgi:hypothetical protein